MRFGSGKLPDYWMNVALRTRQVCAKKFRDREIAVLMFDFACFFVWDFLFTKRDCGQYRATPGAEIFCGKIFTCDWRK